MKEIFVDEEELSDYFFTKLVQRGYVPRQEETDDIAEIMFDWLLEIGLIDLKD